MGISHIKGSQIGYFLPLESVDFLSPTLHTQNVDEKEVPD